MSPLPHHWAERYGVATRTVERWAAGTEWSEIVRETRAEEGDLFRMFSRTGEALLQIAGLHRSHPVAANMATAVAEMVLREPIR